jgi:hypothetical protein
MDLERRLSGIFCLVAPIMNCVARSRGNVDKEPVEARPNFRLASLHVDATGKRVYRDSSSAHIITLIGPATFRSLFEFFKFFSPSKYTIRIISML